MIALFVFLIAAIWFSKKKYKINLSVLGLGAVAFFVSSQVLEKIVHLLVLHPQKDGTVPLMTGNPLLYVIYGVCMAALFEETARLVFFKWLEKKRALEDSDALAYGLGHGGLELLYLGMGRRFAKSGFEDSNNEKRIKRLIKLPIPRYSNSKPP